MALERKTVKFEVKDIDEEEGIFTGYAATFSKRPDSYGDIIDRGAFTKTLKERGKKVKILFNHSVMDPIGRPFEIMEDERGLFVKGKLSLGVQRAREVLSLMKDGVITEMSIGYNVIKETWIDGIRHLPELKLWDASPVVFAANEEAVLLGVKEMELKPFPSEHSCRLRSPDAFEEDSFRRTSRTSGGKKYSVIMGRLEGEDTMTEQAYRYDKDTWEASEAETHCKEHDGTFEAAAEKAGRVLSTSNLEKVNSALKALQSALEALQALLDATEKEPEPGKSTLLLEVDMEAARLGDVIAGLKAENDGFNTLEAEKRIESILEQLKN